MDMRAITVRAEDHGCNTCGARGKVFYDVSFYILPARLKRKRHKEREHMVIYCSECYDGVDALPFVVDGQRLTAAKDGIFKTAVTALEPGPPQAPQCSLCGNPLGHGTLYGVITSVLWMHESQIEERVLAVFCGTCIESRRISLVAKLGFD